jgi:SAM-dependent methyltransferase
MADDHDPDRVFAGSIPEIYDTIFVPLIFQPYADDLIARLTTLPTNASLLEIAAGTGVVTREMARHLPSSISIVATDLNQQMLDRASAIGTDRPVVWRQADAMELPFDDASFDVVVCQFGVMFFPDRPHAYAEVRRVLRPGGRFLFNVWDRIEENAIAEIVTDTMRTMFPDDPPRFLARTPHGYHDISLIRADLQAAGFTSPATINTVPARSRAASTDIPAIAYCHGSPLRNEILARDPSCLNAATTQVTAALTREFGETNLDAPISAHVISVDSPPA